MSKVRKIENVEEMEEFALEFVKSLKKKKSKAILVFLYGELGAGKTTFTRGVLKALGVERNVTSPTFVLMKRYNLDNKDFNTLYHVDAYRLKEGDEDVLGIKKLEKDPSNLIFIEWPERIYKKKPGGVISISFLHGDEEGERVVEL